MSVDPRIDLLRRLTEVTQAQVLAARSMNIAELDRLNADHADLLFELQVALQDPVPQEVGVRDELQARAEELSQARDRLRTLTGTVVSVFDRVLPSRPPPTYGPKGRLTASGR